PPRLHARSAGRANDTGQSRGSERGQPRRIERAAGSQRPDGARRVEPGGVLGQDGAPGDLVWRPARPPALTAAPPVERRAEPTAVAAAPPVGRPAEPPEPSLVAIAGRANETAPPPAR